MRLKLIKSALWFVPAAMLAYAGNYLNNTQVIQREIRDDRIKFLCDTYPQYSEYAKFRDAITGLKEETGVKEIRDLSLQLDDASPQNPSTNLTYILENKERVYNELKNKDFSDAVNEIYGLENQKKKFPWGDIMIGAGSALALGGLLSLTRRNNDNSESLRQNTSKQTQNPQRPQQQNQSPKPKLPQRPQIPKSYYHHPSKKHN